MGTEPHATAGEQRVLQEAPSGELVDLTDLAEDERVVSADAIRRLCVGPEAAAVDPRGIRVLGARVTDALDLAYCSIVHPLRFESATFDEQPDLTNAHVPALVLTECTLPGLLADGIRTAALDLRSADVTGEVRLIDARIEGQLDLSGATLTNDGDALSADFAQISGGVFLREGFSAKGALRFLGARIGGQLDCSGATLSHEGDAFFADGADITGDVFLRGVSAVGGVRLVGARIGGQLECSEGSIDAGDGNALFAEGAQVIGGVFLTEGFTATGEVRLLGARIGGSLDCGAATLNRVGGDALSADSADITGDVFLNRGFSANGAVRLQGARIGASLDCMGATLRHEDEVALHADSAAITGNVFLRDGFTANGAVRLFGARIGGQLECSGASIGSAGEGEERTALTADSSDVTGNVFLDAGFTASGEVRLLGAKIGGQLECSGANLENKGGSALIANNAEITGSVFLDEGFAATGEVRLLGVKIGGSLDFAGATLKNEGGDALFADSVEVTGSVFLNRGFTATGRVRLRGARIGRQLDCSEATLDNGRGHALFANHAEIPGGVFLNNGFSAVGEIRLFGARIGGPLDCSGATLTNGLGFALFANRAEIKGDVLLKKRFSATGQVRLRGADIGGLDCRDATLVNVFGHAIDARDATIRGAFVFRRVRITGGADLFRASAATLEDDLGSGDDSLGSWSGIRPLVLDGFTYARLGRTAKWDARLRRAWLKQTDGFQHDAWQQLVNVYRSVGRDDEATRASIDMHNDRMRRADLPQYRVAARRMLWAVVGHGYRPWLAGIWAAAIIGLFAVALWHWSGLLVAEREGVAGSPQPAAYAADAFFPIIDLEQTKNWSPTDWLRWAEWAVIVLGWALTTLFVAGFTRIVRTQ